MKKILVLLVALCSLGSASPQSALVVGNYGVEELYLLMDVVCSECKGCPRQEQVAVAHVAINRANQPSWWGDGLKGVLTKPYQFAKPNSHICGDSLPPRAGGWSPGMVERHRGILNQIERDVIAVAMGRVEDPTDGATYFHAKRLGRLWSGNVERVPVPQNWLHHFYRKAN
jgi:hypothetical protein